MTIKVLHLKMLTKEERDRLNGPDGGWDSEPRFTRYADITSFAKESAIHKALAMNEYELVATVDTDDKETAFRLTNHIEDDWQLNTEVEPKSIKARSTSVGDLMVDEDGDRWIVAPVGFKRLEDADCEFCSHKAGYVVSGHNVCEPCAVEIA